MVANRRRDTKPEVALRALLHARGLRYRVDYQPLPGIRNRADVVFTRAKVVVFVDGCFWHGCPEHFSLPKTNVDYWEPKIRANRARDERTDALLREAGWTIIRAWEHEDAHSVADRVELAVRSP